MEPPTSSRDPVAAPDDRRWTKQRLYVICQAGGWSFFLAIQLIFLQLFATGSDREQGMIGAAFQGVAVGLLLTHFARRWFDWRGWKELGWRALIPRILGMAALLAAVWVVVCYGIHYGVLGHPFPAKYHPLALVAASLINGIVLMAGWQFIYFFYHLFDRYNRLRIEQLRLVASVKDAELRALKSQINPHFIFNSLNSLRGLIDENPGRAREAVTQLANLLRYSLQSGQLETVPLEDELNTVNDYLALEQVRHEERLRVRLDIAPEAPGVSIPPMLVQTLVENAVKYGIAPRREGGEIAIVARCERDRLRLQVINPGTLAGGGGSTGVGLRNAADRLRLLFGAQASLSLREDPPGRVVAEVLVPLRVASRGPGSGDDGRRAGPEQPAATLSP